MSDVIYLPSILRAMAKNYAGGHRWDHLDSEAVTKAADHIVALEAELAKLRAGQDDHAEQALVMVPAGWKLVPVEPTPEMMKAGCAVPLNKAARHNSCYRAMLAAVSKGPDHG